MTDKTMEYEKDLPNAASIQNRALSWQTVQQRLQGILVNEYSWAHLDTMVNNDLKTLSRSAVLMILVPCSNDGSDVKILLTKRISKVSYFIDEVSFPGGMREEGDADETETALRETLEETGIEARDVKILGQMTPQMMIAKRRPVIVTPVVGYVSNPENVSLHPSPDEVERIFCLPLERFLSARGHRKFIYSDVLYEDEPLSSCVHLFEDSRDDCNALPAVWGLTAHLCVAAAIAYYGRRPEFDYDPGKAEVTFKRFTAWSKNFFAAISNRSSTVKRVHFGVQPSTITPSQESKIHECLQPIFSTKYSWRNISGTKLGSKAKAAVLVLLCAGPTGTTDDLYILLTKRSSELTHEGGTVSFPGGMYEESDGDEVCAALREAEEETGLPSDRVRALGQMKPIVSHRQILVAPVVAVLVRNDFEWKLNEKEVESTFSLPLKRFLSNEGHRARNYLLKESDANSALIETIIHYFHDTVDGEKFITWGLTALICIEVAMAFYWAPPEFQYIMNYENNLEDIGRWHEMYLQSYEMEEYSLPVIPGPSKL